MMRRIVTRRLEETCPCQRTLLTAITFAAVVSRLWWSRLWCQTLFLVFAAVVSDFVFGFETKNKV